MLQHVTLSILLRSALYTAGCQAFISSNALFWSVATYHLLDSARGQLGSLGSLSAIYHHIDISPASCFIYLTKAWPGAQRGGKSGVLLTATPYFSVCVVLYISIYGLGTGALELDLQQKRRTGAELTGTLVSHRQAQTFSLSSSRCRRRRHHFGRPRARRCSIGVP